MATKVHVRRVSEMKEEEFQISIRQARLKMLEGVCEKKDVILEDEYDQFVRRNFRSMDCFYYKEDPRNSSETDKRCFCGEFKNYHKKFDRDYESIKDWDPMWCMKEFPTEAFGQIQFLGEDVAHTKPTEFVRICYKDKVEDVMELLFKYWNIKIGSLCISVIGGAKNFKMRPKDKDIFTQGLVKAAQTTNALIITSGLNLGISKVVGEAVHEGRTLHFDKKKHNNTLCCLGVSPWGYVMRRSRLEKCKGNLVTYKVSNELRTKQPVSLNKDHTHYIFVDEGRRNGFANTEAGNFRASLEKDLAQKTGNRDAIPVVLVVVEGGQDVFVEASRSVKENVPLVICEGTGRASDILGETYRVMLNVDESEDGIRHIPEYFQSTLRKKLLDVITDPKRFEDLKEKEQKAALEKVNDAVGHVEIIVQNECLITLFDIKNTEDLDLAILYSLIKRMKDPKSKFETSICNQILLCLTWNRVDIAKEKIFKDNIELTKEEWNRILDEALRNGKFEFVELFLQHGAYIHDYLSVGTLTNLYVNCTKTEYFHGTVWFYLKRPFSNDLEDVKELLVKMIGRCTLPTYTDIEVGRFRHPFQELFLWAVLMEKYELAKLFWERSEESILLCLVATKILLMIMKTALFQEVERLEMLDKWKDYYEVTAIKVLEECSEINRESAAFLIEKKNCFWGDLTCLELAHRANDQRFISCVVCQNSIDFTWKSGLKIGFPRCLFAIFLPILIIKSQTYENASIRHAFLKPENSLSPFKRLQSFYNAPQTKFWIHLIFHISFLMYFSFVVLFFMKRYTITIHEVFLMLYLICSIVDKIIEMCTFNATSTRNRLLDWWDYSLLNKVQVLFMIFSLIAILLRVPWNNYAIRNWVMIYRVSKTIYSVMVGYLFLKLLRYIIIHPNLGPKMVMIGEMIRELILYLVIIMIILLAYGVTSQAAYYPERKFDATHLSNVIDTPYWTLFGELSLSNTVYLTWCIDNATDFSGPNECPELNVVVPVIYSIYIFIANILLLNVLIAIFSKIFQDIHQNSIVIWKFNMYSLMLEYKSKPILPAPFSVLTYLVAMIRYLLRRRCFRKSFSITDKYTSERRYMCKSLDLDEECIELMDSSEGFMGSSENKSLLHKLNIFEAQCQSTVVHDRKMEAEKSMEYRILNMENGLKKLSSRIQGTLSKVDNFLTSEQHQKPLREGSLEQGMMALRRQSSVFDNKVLDMNHSMNLILDELRNIKQSDITSEDLGRQVKEKREIRGDETRKKLVTLRRETSVIVEEDDEVNRKTRDMEVHNMIKEINKRDEDRREDMDRLERKVDEMKETLDLVRCMMKDYVK